ncbi:MAG: hypothetical protein WDO73_37890 [Ignavibacteriota bacterium]
MAVTPGSIYANVTADDKLLFISDERLSSITVIDLPRARAPPASKRRASWGRIPPSESLPSRSHFQSDGKLLYTTSELAAPDWKWPNACTAEGTR